ncbi:MAG TPA: UdgX family uracil-DNA binding protein [Acidimicrobiales bacterium]|nr:UdgX family uracil-DNA binding protein [Acidimicrobiales bacterium]
MVTIDELRQEAATCQRCTLYQRATATVFGEGSPGARVVVVGEQPGDQEDRRGRPFVGPAGQLLDRAFEASGLARQELYVTNAVKHFKWVPRGKRRLHQTPSRTEVAACRPWLEGELVALSPRLAVALGATAGKALLGTGYRVTADRGRPLSAEVGPWQGPVIGTVHPAAVLRVTDPAEREAEFATLVADLTVAASYLDGGAPG